MLTVLLQIPSLTQDILFVKSFMFPWASQLFYLVQMEITFVYIAEVISIFICTFYATLVISPLLSLFPSTIWL